MNVVDVSLQQTHAERKDGHICCFMQAARVQNMGQSLLTVCYWCWVSQVADFEASRLSSSFILVMASMWSGAESQGDPPRDRHVSCQMCLR